MPKLFLLALLIIGFLGCDSEKELPILGETTVDVNGNLVHYKAPEFELLNQDDETVNSTEFEGEIQVIDFFFTSCPTICPKMTSHLKVVEEAFKDEDRVNIISFSIDPEMDTPERLNNYARQYDINTANWTFFTGDSQEVFELAKDYKVRAFKEGEDQSSLLHDGTFVLVDGKSRIRGYYNGLDIADSNRLITDIKSLLKEH